VTIRKRRDGWQVIVYAGLDPLTGKQRQLTRQVNGSRRQAEKVEARLRTEVADGKHAGTRVKTLGELHASSERGRPRRRRVHGRVDRHNSRAPTYGKPWPTTALNAGSGTSVVLSKTTQPQQSGRDRSAVGPTSQIAW
jgi:Arm DNA-binding domain